MGHEPHSLDKTHEGPKGEPDENMIRQCVHEIWLEEGMAERREIEHWLRARRTSGPDFRYERRVRLSDERRGKDVRTGGRDDKRVVGEEHALIDAYCGGGKQSVADLSLRQSSA
jgi:hypothetical protein